MDTFTVSKMERLLPNGQKVILSSVIHLDLMETIIGFQAYLQFMMKQ